MISRSRGEGELPTEQEGGIVNYKVATSSRLWSGLSNPRIVRVSRAFGGKDRHSKVSTVRGLRDRRVRLSVPTAIQLYDLQERLGLNQPSKVVDWLLNAAQDEIDKLPPLPMLPGNFIQFSQSLEIPRESTPPQSSSHSSMIGDAGEARARSLSFLFSKPTSKAIVEQDLETLPKASYWNSDTSQREVEIEKGNFIRINEVETHDAGLHSTQVAAHDPNFRTSHSFFSGLLSNTMPYSSYHNSEASNDYASHMGVHPSQMEVPSASIASSLSLAPGSHLVLCPSGSSIPRMFPQHITASTGMQDARQFGQYQMATLASQDFLSHPMRNYLHSNMASKPHHSQDNHES